MTTFGKRFKELRLEKGLKQQDLIDEFNKKFHFNFTKAAVSQYENDKRIPEIQALTAFADYFNVSVDYLLGKTNERMVTINEHELSPHEQIALKIAKVLAEDGLEYTDDIIPEIVSYSGYLIKKKQDE